MFFSLGPLELLIVGLLCMAFVAALGSGVLRSMKRGKDSHPATFPCPHCERIVARGADSCPHCRRTL